MSKTWKWILGVALVLVLVAAMFAIGYTWQARMAYGWSGAWDHPMMRGDWYQRGAWDHPMTRGDWYPRDAWKRPMMGGAPYSMHGWYTPFGGFFLLGGLVKFALFIGLLYGAYWLGRRNARIALDPHPAARVDASAPPEESR